ncbi:hypothetical protein [Dyadobacter sp. LHD-138]|uniref:hypothetical protein n=1 Tax=Dyadobacter sp. LHD-138 TaxID=3071413 RepID=UPI0027E1E635|nr:hypothetical protein [Dyadobacter sp. LHD-138]MDQ6481131.1 hypothetical protein [Dyadobacter sp. LHD-138]
MNLKLLSASLLITFSGCNENKKTTTETNAPSIVGTWELVSAKIITQGDTAVTFPVKDQKMLKIFSTESFAFFKHDINKGTGDTAVFESGAGTYTLKGEDYAEHLEFCNYRGWENQDFKFKLRLKKDTLIQRGVEKIDSLNIDREIVETYVKR